ncbi:tRNA (adenosine(37)-N6)-threonylcarbamoyltransferase complex dimerization subunit type 1 TsaB [Alteraurantiacibacter aquimixticola]|uniref:tRNA (Adenosine(37)-N6)-threonylcarbamoyltransferase complex dimerization subunit type 1 TsaB n=1 Tax=Alteraurantiacibacter aquimixticola TaxID=2489173 RepID=A0A4V4U8M1_9SPHN|nr:tRNA (adenosine(37)-N6)-threonylcarbamoyltransferase complex dimerization subunit type 1 TsaB [Alteraurantiacibacter aquimixticola]TIX50513.1 tRNA (adenosine(37)-N6)-threonylcarbamoyltransferase complex dimerization subunit type 1 TsaB [Alteraurantiacibacter aquimixticola]
MRMLAIDCATEACSAALFDGSQLVEGRFEILGRGHAERLVPMIAELPDKGRADRIVVSLGPGSFTGVRIGLAAARALGIAWGAEVLGYPTLSLVAARTWQPDPRPVTVCMNGGHGEWFVQNFANSMQAEDKVRSLSPADAAAACRHGTIAGNRAKELAELLGDDRLALDLLPDARQAHLLHETQLLTDLSPIYGRGPDAKLPGGVSA